MSWKTFHHRVETLRAATSTANDRCDGQLPVDVPGVTDDCADEVDRTGARTSATSTTPADDPSTIPSLADRIKAVLAA